MDITQLSRLAICVPVWGEAFWTRFREGLVRDLLSEGNIPAVLAKGIQVEILVYTDQAGMAQQASLLSQFALVDESIVLTFIDITELDDCKSKYSSMDRVYKHSMDQLNRMGGGVLMCLCADTIMTKNLIRNSLQLWHNNPQSLFVMPGISVAERKFKSKQWHDVSQQEQVNMLVASVDNRMLDKHIHSSRFYTRNPSMMLSGSVERGFLIAGFHWHPVFVEVNEHTFDFVKSYRSQIDRLEFVANGNLEEQVLFCPSSDVAAVASVSDDDLAVNMHTDHFDPFRVASWAKKIHSVDVDLQQRLSHRYYLRNADQVIPEHEQETLINALALVVEAGKHLAQSEVLQEFYAIQNVHDRLTWWCVNKPQHWGELVSEVLNDKTAQIDKPLYVFGDGEHTDMLLKFTDLASRLDGIIVPNSKAQGAKSHFEYHLERDIPSLTEQQSIAVIISSVSYQDDIKARLEKHAGVQVITLYQNNILQG